jgi:hypothetical protein
MPFLVLSLVAVLGLGFVWLLFGVARAAPPYRADGDTFTFRHGKLLRLFAVVVFFAAPLVFGLWLLFFPPRSNATLMPAVVGAARPPVGSRAPAGRVRAARDRRGTAAGCVAERPARVRRRAHH